MSIRHVLRDEQWPWWLPLAFGGTTIAAAVIVLVQRDALFPPTLATLAGLVIITPCLVDFTGWMLPRPIYGITVLAGVAALAVWQPVEVDLSVLLLYLMVGEVAAIAGMALSVTTAVVSAALIVVLDLNDAVGGPWIWAIGIAVCWQVGLTLRVFQQALIRERELRVERTAQAALAERQRIAREVHDVVGHSLSVTMLHVTAARHALTSDGDVAEAVDALSEAEQVGRQAMSDIRRTVGLLTATTGPADAMPGAADIPALLDDLTAAGADVTYRIHGDVGAVPAADGLGLYRIVQESLANVVKHAPGARVVAELDLLAEPARLTIRNTLPAGPVEPALGPAANGGAGLPGMRQRAELLDGRLTAGPEDDEWLVSLTFPNCGSGGGGDAGRGHPAAAGR